MPCDLCSKSAFETSNGVTVGLRVDEDGTHRYTCLTCFREALEDSLEGGAS